MSGTRRARTLVAGIQSSLGAALALADRLEEQAAELESGAAPSVTTTAAAGSPGRPGAATQARSGSRHIHPTA
ncbi:hypothetical protein ND748_29895, partial [Frankia sp. AiPs1]|uniref:hypothetical protein n=1 Tax=Frankia sp. AiPs1 TaxID=573493 RepID=UPI0020442F52